MNTPTKIYVIRSTEEEDFARAFATYETAINHMWNLVLKEFGGLEGIASWFFNTKEYDDGMKVQFFDNGGYADCGFWIQCTPFYNY